MRCVFDNFKIKMPKFANYPRDDSQFFSYITCLYIPDDNGIMLLYYKGRLTAQPTIEKTINRD